MLRRFIEFNRQPHQLVKLPLEIAYVALVAAAFWSGDWYPAAWIAVGLGLALAAVDGAWLLRTRRRNRV